MLKILSSFLLALIISCTVNAGTININNNTGRELSGSKAIYYKNDDGNEEFMENFNNFDINNNGQLAIEDHFIQDTTIIIRIDNLHNKMYAIRISSDRDKQASFNLSLNNDGMLVADIININCITAISESEYQAGEI